MDTSGVLHIEPPAKAAMAAFCRGSLKGKPVEVVIRRKRLDRTPPQVRYYMGVIIPEFAHFEGYRRDEHYMLHDGLMHKFWPLEPDPVTKSPRRRRLRLHDQGHGEPLSVEEMTIHIDQVVMFAAERGCVISECNSRDLAGESTTSRKKAAA